MDFARRRQAIAAPPSDDAGDPRLLARIRAEIERDGPLTFARFMQLALYEPELGYYATSAERPTRAGDFVTAAEVHPIFGRCVARQLDEMWRRLGRPEPFTLREYGAGGGALIMAIVEELEADGSGLRECLAYQPRDLPLQLVHIERRLADAGRLGLLERTVAGKPLVGCVLANEFVDALPVHRVVAEQGELNELFVDWVDGRLVERSGPLSDGALADWFGAAGVELREGQQAEVNLAFVEWLAEVGAELERGYVLVIDYGAEPPELYGAHRQRGTIRAFRGQHVSTDPLGGVGRQDMTAHVDLAAVERGALSAGLEVLGRNTQAEFLMGCGLEELLVAEQRRTADDWQAGLLLRSAVGRLLDPRALGGYAVIALGRGVDHQPPLRGIAYRRPARA